MALSVEEFNQLAAFIAARLQGAPIAPLTPPIDFAAEKAGLERRIKGVQAEILQVRAEVTANQQRAFQEATKRRDVLKTYVSQLEGALATLAEKVAEATEKNKALQQERDNVANEQKELSGKQVTAAGDLDRLATAVSAVPINLGGA